VGKIENSLMLKLVVHIDTSLKELMTKPSTFGPFKCDLLASPIYVIAKKEGGDLFCVKQIKSKHYTYFGLGPTIHWVI
jgi:hypothetical protein